MHLWHFCTFYQLGMLLTTVKCYALFHERVQYKCRLLLSWQSISIQGATTSFPCSESLKSQYQDLSLSTQLTHRNEKAEEDEEDDKDEDADQSSAEGSE